MSNLSKKYKLFLFVICAILLNFVLINLPQNVQAEENIYDIYENVNFANDRVIVVINNEESLKFKEYSVSDFPEIELNKVENLSKSLEERIQKQIKGENNFTTTIDITRFRVMLLLHLKNSGRSEVLNSIAILTNRYDVECAEPDIILELYTSTLQNGNVQFRSYLDEIDIYKAWNYTCGDSSIKVGVIDSGIKSDHQALAGKVNEELSRDFLIDDPYISSEIIDTGGHGTGVASVISSNNNDGYLGGVAPNIELVSLRIIESSPFDGLLYCARLVEAINYASTTDIKVLNISCGVAAKIEFRPISMALFTYPGFVVFASGNDGVNIDEIFYTPPSIKLSNTITVGAIDLNDNRWIGSQGSSNYGSISVDIYAPGESIIVPSISEDYQYTIGSGTSLAAPQVAGVAALMLSLNPNLTPEQLKVAIKSNAETISITYPDGSLHNVKKLNAFKAVRSVAFDLNEEGNAITGLNFESGEELVIPDTINGVVIKSISAGVFKDKANLKRVTLPNGLESLGANVFENCTSLENITIPSSLKTIGSGAFKNCDSLIEMNLPTSLQSIGADVFSDCSNLQSVNFSSSCTINILLDGVFKNCTSLESVVLPNSLSMIISTAFENCCELDSLTLPNGITRIFENTFKNCTNLSVINIPSSVIEIDKDAFVGTGIWTNATNNDLVYVDDWCIGYKGIVENIELKNWVVGIGNSAFERCNSLISFKTSPQSDLKYIGSSAFRDCVNLEEFKTKNELVVLGGGAFSNCEKIVTIEFDMVDGSVLYNSVFSGCTMLSSITIPNGIAPITTRPFYKLGNYNTRLTVYTKEVSRPDTWDELWHMCTLNNLKLETPTIVWGCTLAEVGNYVVSINNASSNFDKAGSVSIINSISDPCRYGYIFGGWQNGEDIYTSEQIVTAPIATYQAIWIPKQYDITYRNVGDTTFNGNLPEGYPIKHIYDTETILSVPTRTGYTFEGWYLSSVGDGLAVTTIPSHTMQNITLYAKWTANEYNINYYDVGNVSFTGEFSGEYPTIHTYGTTTILVSPIKVGYTFVGWYKNSNGTLGTTSLYGAGYTNDIDLYAKWEVNSYNIVYLDQGGETFSGQQPDNQSYTHTYDTATPILSPTKMGYTFSGWYTNSNLIGDSITELSSTGYTADITLYAKWTANEYAINYYDQGGETFSGNLEDVPTTHTYDTETELPIAKKYLYDVEGWYLTSDCTGEPITSLSATGYTADIALYAKWTYATYTINYVGRVTIEGEYTHTYNTETVLIVPSNPVYTFHGWYLTSNYSGEPITTLSATGYTDDITLYGKWTETEFTLTYYDLDGNLLTGTQIEGFPTVYRYEQYLELPQLDTSEYTLFGWCIDSPNGVARDYLYTTYYRDLSLYATWKLGGKLKINPANYGYQYKDNNECWNFDSITVTGDNLINYQIRVYRNSSLTIQMNCENLLMNKIVLETVTGYSSGLYATEGLLDLEGTTYTWVGDAVEYILFLTETNMTQVRIRYLEIYVESVESEDT